MTELNFPKYSFKIREKDGKLVVLDTVRKKYVVLTPEEWVRQHMIRFMIEERSYPLSLLSVEGSMKLYELSKRTDIVAYRKSGTPVLIVECKSPEVKITRNAFDQAARYNMGLDVNYLVITNGLHHFYARINSDLKQYDLLDSMPAYNEL